MSAVLLVVSSLTLSVTNTAIRDALVAAGHTVTLRTFANADKTVPGDCAVLTDGTGSSDLIGYAGSTKGIVNLAHATWDDFNLFTGGTSAMTASGVTLVELDSAHPIIAAAGFTDGQQITAFSSAVSVRQLADANVGGAGTVIARYPQVFGGRVAAWAYEKGVLLADGVNTAPGRRVATPPLSTNGEFATADLLDFVVAATEWAAATLDTTPPTAPVLNAPSVAGNDVTLTWSASSDASGVTHYEVHRSATNGFTPITPGAGTWVASPTGLTYTDNDRPDGTWYYKIVAVDGATPGNRSAASNQGTAVVDTAPAGAPTASATRSTVESITASATGGTAPYTYSFTQVSGPAVVLSGSGATRTFTRPVPLNEAIEFEVVATGANAVPSPPFTLTVPADGRRRPRVSNGTEFI